MSYKLPADLWEPQRRAVSAGIEAVRLGKDICIQAPTGGGKTRCSIEWAKWCIANSKQMVFYTNRKLLTEQTSASYAKAGVDHGVRAAEYDDMFDDMKPVQICSADTEWVRVLGEKASWAPYDADVVVIDEVHLQKATKMQSLIEDHKSRGAQIIALTATPVEVAHMADELFISGTMKEYRVCKALVPAMVKSIEQPDLRKVKRNRTGEYIIDDKKRFIYTQTIVASVIDRYERYNPDRRPALMYAPCVASSRWLADQFANRGHRFCHVDATEMELDGKRQTLTRSVWADILDMYRDGAIHGITSRFKCLDMQTEVLTPVGWKSRHDILPHDYVAAMTPDGSLSWDRIEKIIDSHHNGEFCEIHNLSLDVRVTDDHDLIVRSQDKRCKTWKKEQATTAAMRRGTFQIPVAVNGDSKDLPLSDDQIRLIAWMMTDGHMAKDGRWHICQSTSKPKAMHDDIKRALDGCNIKWTEAEYEARIGDKQYAPAKRYTISRKEVERTGVSGVTEKDFCTVLLGLSRRQTQILLHSINLADGVHRKSAAWMPRTLKITKGNDVFLSRLQALCVTRGMRANLHKTENRCAILYVTPGRTYATVRGCNSQDNVKIEMRNADEQTWCVSVSTGTLVTRRHGKVAIVGNCREGIDLPLTYHCILATPIGSLASYLQTVGRVLRHSKETPNVVLVTDHGGNYHTHGSPNHDRAWDEWWDLPAHAVSDMHMSGIQHGKIAEPLRCPKCELERLGGVTCPGCGFQHVKSHRVVVEESGRMREYEGELVQPKLIKREPNTQKLWDNVFWRFRKHCQNKTFRQAEAWFYQENFYYPPRDLNHMPVKDAGWYAAVGSVPNDQIRWPDQCVDSRQLNLP